MNGEFDDVFSRREDTATWNCTRLVPTMNGPMHMGHAYMALVNYAEARARGWAFRVRFDDNQLQYLMRLGWEKIDALKQKWLDDLAFLGIQVDHSYSESSVYRHALSKLYGTPGFPHVPTLAPADYAHAFVSPPDIFLAYYPEITSVKVVMDHEIKAKMLFRGIDCITEFALYRYFEDLLGYEEPIAHVFLPRLTNWDGSVLSKTNGAESIHAWGATGEEIVHILKRACLKYPEGDFVADNIKADPRLPEPRANAAGGQ